MKLFLCICTSLLLLGKEKIDYIKYKQACEAAYDAALEHDSFEEALVLLDEIDLKIPLKAEELFLKAYCYKSLGKNSEAAKMLRKAWGTPFLDYSIIFENGIKELNPQSLMLGFNDEQKILVEQGYELYTQRRTPLGDSLTKVLEVMVEKDQKAREQRMIMVVTYGEESDSTKMALQQIKYVDSCNQAELKGIIAKFGFPGDEICPGTAYLTETLMLHAASPSFYKEMKSILFDEIKKGHLAPSIYAVWEDRYYRDYLHQSYYDVYLSLEDFKGEILPYSTMMQNRYKIGFSKHFGNYKH